MESDAVSDDNDNDDLDSNHDDDSDEEIRSIKGDQFENSLQRVFNESERICEFVETIPQNLNGDCVFVLNAQNKSKILEKCRNARPWKRDSKTKQKNFNNIRYRNCSGSHKCLSEDCKFFLEYKFANQLKF